MNAGMLCWFVTPNSGDAPSNISACSNWLKKSSAAANASSSRYQLIAASKSANTSAARLIRMSCFGCANVGVDSGHGLFCRHPHCVRSASMSATHRAIFSPRAWAMTSGESLGLPYRLTIRRWMSSPRSCGESCKGWVSSSFKVAAMTCPCKSCLMERVAVAA